MRDRDVYLRAGRNDPLDDVQREEHPYDFVSLPAGPAKAEAAGHDRYRACRSSGALVLTYETLAPLHVGSGVLETAAECGLEGGERPVRGIVRCQGRPVLPGSSWKGAVRARYEAITRSRLPVLKRTDRAPAFKIPGPLRSGDRSHRLEIVDSRVLHTLKAVLVKGSGDPVRDRRALAELSPADALFGAPGYRGHVHPGDGAIAGPAAARPLAVMPMESPAMHRLAAPGGIEPGNRPGELKVTRVEGRKFYYDGGIVAARRRDGGEGASEWIDQVPPGSRITIEVHLESVTRAELGGLLLAAGFGDGVGVVRFGGFKPAGLGKVRLVGVTGDPGEVAPALRIWRRAGEGRLDAGALAAAVAEARRDLIDGQALAELHEVTTRCRP